jgi:hypothetical protein
MDSREIFAYRFWINYVKVRQLNIEIFERQTANLTNFY